MTTPDPLAAAAADRPDHVALDAPDRTWTYADLDNVVDDLARRLASLGLSPGATVATLVPDGPQAVGLVHAVARAGLTLAPLHGKWTDHELIDYLNTIRPDLVVCSAETEARAAFVTQAPPLVSVDAAGDSRALALMDRPRTEGELPGPPEVLNVVATSGTSGAPRGAELTREAHAHIARASRDRLGLTPDDRWLYSLSVAHVGGLALVLRAAHLGAALVHRGRFDAQAWAGLVDEGVFTHASLVPTQLHRLIAARGERPAPDPLELLLVGGAACPRPLLDRALELDYPVALTYGQTEATSQVATAPPSLVRRVPGTVGQPLEGVRVRIDDGGATEGEVLVAGPTLMRGYRGAPDDEVLVDEWLHTGDVGRLDPDGRLWITGRARERIVTGGVTVDPRQVEEVLLKHWAVDQACVVGVPDREWGERVSAAVVPVKGERPSVEELSAHAAERLSQAKRPRAFVFLEALPLNPNGKVDRGAVRRLFEKG